MNLNLWDKMSSANRKVHSIICLYKEIRKFSYQQFKVVHKKPLGEKKENEAKRKKCNNYCL